MNDLLEGPYGPGSAYPEIERCYPAVWSIFDYLDQSTWWTPRDAEPITLDEMMPSHRANLLRFLRARAHMLGGWHIAESLRILAGFRGEMATTMVEDALEAEFERIVDDPVAWLEHTPLITRLRELVEAADAIAAIGPEWWEN